MWRDRPNHADIGDMDCEQWETNNFVLTDDNFLVPNTQLMDELHKRLLWKVAPRYFKSVKVSVQAALKMMVHAGRGRPNVTPFSENGVATFSSYLVPEEPRRENWFEVMGILLGHFNESEIIITDAFALPVNASEVECSMNEESQLYMLDYLQYHQRTWTKEGCVGWYHSHPGYSCFLSGTDVNTQQLGQSAQDPWLAIVVDPINTIATGKLDIKAFRTFPESYVAELQKTQQQVSHNMQEGKQQEATASNVLPFDRIREYGVHAHRYYELPITFVRSNADKEVLERLWDQYWTVIFCRNTPTVNRQIVTQHINQLVDVLKKKRCSNPGMSTECDNTDLQRLRCGSKVCGDSNVLFKENDTHINNLTSALISEMTLDGVFMAVKSTIFSS